MDTDDRYEPIDYVLKELDIARIHERTGKKHLVRCDGFSGDINEKVQAIGRTDKENGMLIIQFVNTPCAVFYATVKVKKKILKTVLGLPVPLFNG